ncbi:MAG: D-alanyl-D-alanine carboxypeptidase family protein [Ruminococcus sp.]|nr:D-alanyl-D-alanine carboxypeptidase family protein [Ruminococcus sp.]
MAQRRRRESTWQRFSRNGVILIVLYLLFIILGFSVRLLFFSEDKTTSIVPDDNIASAEGTTTDSSTTTGATTAGDSEATNENILELKVESDFLAILEGNSATVSVNMSTTGTADASDLTWSSDDESIATVDASGVITGVKKGTCTVTIAVKGNASVSHDTAVTVHHLEEVDGCTYIDSILIVNKSYCVPENYDPGLYDEVAEAFEQMKADAAEEGLNLYIGSSYRDYAYQVEIYNNYSELYGSEMADTFSARPGYSEHQSGYVIDCNTIDDAFGDTDEAVWLAEHCAEYGFIIRYLEGKEDITGYKYEPWHIRYVGVEVATEITELGLTLEEYLGVDSVYAD